MEEDRDRDQACYGENWLGTLGTWEDETISEFDQQQLDLGNRLQIDRDETERKLWLLFQHSAACVAQLYKDRHQGLSVWIPFQNAAAAITQLYKDSADSVRRAYDLGVQTGHRKRSHELLTWAKKRRHHIRREDLIAYLCNRNPPRKPAAGLARTPTRVSINSHHGERVSQRSPPLRVSHDNLVVETDEPDLQPFRDALDLHGLDGAMSNVSVGYRPANSPRHGAPTAGFDSDLSRFIMNEFSRHNERKRASSPNDVTMDSPSRKRSRLF